MTKDTWIDIDGDAFNVTDLRLVVLPSHLALRLFFRNVEEPFTITFATSEERNRTHAEIRRCLGFTS